MTIKPQKKVFFVSDAHFGIPDRAGSFIREKKFIDWLDKIKSEASDIFIMGDLFEFWFEYKSVVQKGYIRLLGKLAEIRDMGVNIHFFKGNHDVWAFNYLEQELGVRQYSDPQRMTIMGTRFYLAHGDGLGEGDQGYKFLKKIFRCRVNQWFFRWLHPDIGSRLGKYWSGKSRDHHIKKNIEKVNKAGINRLQDYALKVLQMDPDIDYFVFGHIHHPVVITLNDRSKYFSLGDWINHFSYAEFDGNSMELKYYNS